MSRKSANAIAEAKKWFSVRNYLRIAKFGAFEWLDQIKKRVAIQVAFDRDDKPYLGQAILRLIENPLASSTEASKQLSDLGKPKSVNVIRDLELADINALQQVVASGSGKLESSPTATLKQLQLRPSAMRTAPPVLEGYVVIRLDGTDKEIVEGVKAWLKERRQLTPEVVLNEWADDFALGAAVSREVACRLKDELPEHAEVCAQKAEVAMEASSLIRAQSSAASSFMVGLQGSFEDWHFCKIIQYFDLTAWARWSGVHLTDSEKSELLFPMQDQGGDRSLKNSKTLCEDVFRDEVVLDLLYLGAARAIP